MARKKKQGPKKGHVVRISPELWDLLSSQKGKKESVSKTLSRLLHLQGNREEFWLLPKSLLAARTIEDARGMAILKCVQEGKKNPVEEPIRVLKAPA